MPKYRFEKPHIGRFDTADLPSDEVLDKLAADCKVAGDEIQELGYASNVAHVLYWFADQLSNKIDRLSFVAEYYEVVLWIQGSHVLRRMDEETGRLVEAEEEIPYGIPVEDGES